MEVVKNRDVAYPVSTQPGGAARVRLDVAGRPEAGMWPATARRDVAGNRGRRERRRGRSPRPPGRGYGDRVYPGWPMAGTTVGGWEAGPMGNDRIEATEHPAGTSPARPRRHTGWLVAVVALVVVVLDVGSKSLVVARLSDGESVRAPGGLVYFSLIRNPGAAFGLASGMTVLLALIAAAVVTVIVRVATRLRSVPWALALGLLMGGALGNLLDRLFRAPGFLHGHVVDFISLFGPDAAHFPAFNLADSAVTTGAVVLAVTSLLGIGFDGVRGQNRYGTPEEPPTSTTSERSADSDVT